MRRSHRLSKFIPLLRTIGILSAVGIITTAVTFSALQSNGNALTGNTIETATASLQLSTDNGITFSSSVKGFDFNNIVPGGSAQPGGGYNIAVKNSGSTNLVLSLGVPTEPIETGITDLSTVHVLVTPLIGGGETYPAQSMTLAALRAGNVTLTWGTNRGLVAAGSTQNFSLQVSMDSTAVIGGSASITGLDLAFSGTPQ